MGKQVRWQQTAMEAYQQAGDSLKDRGYRAMREIKDPEGNAVFTLWAGRTAPHMLIQQTWCDTGDVVFYAPYLFDTEAA